MTETLRHRRLVAIGPSNIGDALMCLPALRAAGQKFSCDKLTLFLGPRAFESLNGRVEGVDTRLLKRPKKLGDWLELGRELRKMKPVSFLDFRRSAVSVLVKPWSPRVWLSVLMNLLPHGHTRHAAEQAFVNARLPVPLKFGANPEAFGVRPAHNLETAHWDEFFQTEKPIVVLQLGASHGPKRYPTAQFQQVAQELESQNFAVVWVGVLPSEELPQNLPASQLNLINNTSFDSLIWVMNQARAVISNDGGPLHLAAALGLPTLGLFGQTDHRTYGPYSPIGASLQSPSDCSPCNTAKCRFGDPFCLKELPPEAVTKAFEKLLQQPKLPSQC